MTSFYFSHPSAFALFALLAASTTYFLLRKRTHHPRLLAMALPRALKTMVKRTRRHFRILFAFCFAGLAILILAICRPTRLESWTDKSAEGIDIVVTLDVSESMEADDLKPTRILSAKSVIRDFVKGRVDDRIGLVIFGGESMTKSPLTRDHDFLLAQVEDVRLRELRQGTAIGMGLSNAIARLKNSESRTKVIVLITDGDSNVGSINPITAAHLARQEGIRIYTIGIGKDTRVIVPIYSYDIQGRRGQLIAQVPSYINPELLAKIAALTGGRAYMAKDSGMLRRILQEIDSLEKNKIQFRPRERRIELFLVPALLALGLLFLLDILLSTRFRRMAAA